MRVYSYGCRAPVENAQLVAQQLRLANSFQRALVAIEHKRRFVVDWLYRHALPVEHAALGQAAQEAAVAAEKVRLLRSRPGGVKPDEAAQAEMRAKLEAAKAELEQARQVERAAREAWYAAHKAARPRLARRVSMCNRGAIARGKYAYNAAGTVGLAWGTRLRVGEFADRAAQAAFKAGTLPRMPIFDGGGTVAVQLQGESGIGAPGLAPSKALSGTDTRFHLETMDAASWQKAQGRSAFVGRNGNPLPQPDPHSKRSLKRQLGGGYAIARLRIGTDAERKPIWAAWPLILHRPLPEVPIKWVQMRARRVGPRTEWHLLVTVDDSTVPARTPEGRLPGTLALNLGWRSMPDGGLRVGMAAASDGFREEIRVPPAYVSGVAHVESLRSIRDRLFVEALKTLSGWLDEREVPAWFAEATRHRGSWKSQKKLAQLVEEWRRRRFAGDKEKFEVFAAWAKKDRHLWFWEADERAKLLRMRLDVYRNISARLATRYGTIVVADMDLRDFAEHPAPEEGARSEGQDQRRSRMLAAPSVLLGALKNACSTRNAAVIELDAKYKTQTCHACGIVFAFAAATKLVHTCDCGATWDQDLNHCLNLLASSKVRQATQAPEKKTRWQKKKAPKEQKAPAATAAKS